MINRVFTSKELIDEIGNVPWHSLWNIVNTPDCMYWCGKRLIPANGKWIAYDGCPYCGENRLNDKNVCGGCGVPLWWWV